MVTTSHLSVCAPLPSLRASAFHMKDGHQLGEWVESVGLEMYRHLVEKHVPSGDRLVAMTAKQHDNTDLVVRGYCNYEKKIAFFFFFFFSAFLDIIFI